MANRRVTDLDPIATAPVSGVMHFVDTTDNTQNAAGSSFKVTKEDFLKENTAAILLNTDKVSFDSESSTRLANTSGVNTGDQDLSTFAKFLQVATYAALTAITTPLFLTIVKVLNDENKGIVNSTYHLYPDGVRMWVASTQDN